MKPLFALAVTVALAAACRTPRTNRTDATPAALADVASATDVSASPSSADAGASQHGLGEALSRFYRRIPSRRDAAAMTAATEAWRRFFVGPARSEPPMPVEFVGADGERGLSVRLEALPSGLSLMHATDPESDCMSHRAVLLTPDGDVGLGTELFGREFANGGLECAPRQPRIVGDPAMQTAVVRDGQEALLLVRTAPGWTFARTAPSETCAPREVATACGVGIYCEAGGAMAGVVPPLDDRAARCLEAAFEVEREFDRAIVAADARAATVLSPSIDTSNDTMVQLPAEDSACPSRDRAALDRAKRLVRTQFVEWAIEHGDGPRPRGNQVTARRRAAAAHPPTIDARCPDAQGAFLLTAGFDDQRDGAGSEVFVTSKTVWRFDGTSATLLDSIDARELYGVTVADIDGDSTAELVVYTHTWESPSRRIRAYSPSRAQYVTVWADEARDGRTRDERVMVLRDEQRTVFLVDWIAHRWTARALTPTPLQSSALRGALSRRSSAHDARATARDAIARTTLDARMLDDALTVAGVDPARTQQLVRALGGR
ncbi:MAG: hypothetical protein U0269_16895 [Polyangiales bacterium]